MPGSLCPAQHARPLAVKRAQTPGIGFQILAKATLHRQLLFVQCKTLSQQKLRINKQLLYRMTFYVMHKKHQSYFPGVKQKSVLKLFESVLVRATPCHYFTTKPWHKIDLVLEFAFGFCRLWSLVAITASAHSHFILKQTTASAAAVFIVFAIITTRAAQNFACSGLLQIQSI